MRDGLVLFKNWILNDFARAANILLGWKSQGVSVTHRDDRSGGNPEADDAPPYGARLHMPPDFDYHATLPALSGGTELSKALQMESAKRSLRKKTATLDGKDGGRWITVHPNGAEAEGHPVYIVPNPDGSHTIVGGASGKLNGLRLTGVKSPDEYKRYGSEQRAAKQRQLKIAEAARRQAIGAEQYVQEQAAKRTEREEASRLQQESERSFVADVFAARGHDASLLDLPAEKLKGIPPETAARLQSEHHRALLAYANAVAEGVEQRLVAGFDSLAADLLGDAPELAGQILRQAVGSAHDATLGYSAAIRNLAEEHGLTDETAASGAESASWRALLEKSEGDVAAAESAAKGSERRTAAAAETRAKTSAAAKQLADTSGIGPEAIRALSADPTTETMSQAATILAAKKRMETTRAQVKDFNKDLDAVRNAGRIPQAAVAITRDMDEGAARQAVAESLSQKYLTEKMMEMVDATNDMEAEEGTLRQHYSVGANATLNAIAQAVGRTTVDPLLQDTLGVAAASRLLVEQWRQSLSPKEFRAARTALASHHVKTQSAIADAGLQEAAEYLAAADELRAHADTHRDLSTDEGIAAAMMDESRIADHVGRAKAAAGEARGRLEAAAAVNEGFLHGAKQTIQTTLGQIPPDDAMLRLAAIGLTDPGDFDKDGKCTREGEFTLHRNAGNAIVDIHPAGVARLALPADPVFQERVKRSTEIKRGEKDEVGWIPAGITKRQRTTYDLAPDSYVQTGHVLAIDVDDDANTILQKTREHIGSLIQEGMDPFDALSSVSSASFQSGLALHAVTEDSYRQALATIAPSPASLPPGTPIGEKAEAAAANREVVRAQLLACADDYVKATTGVGEAIDKQRVPVDAIASDCVYTAMLADPRTQTAFKKLGDLGRDDREQLRSYAYEKLFGLDRKSDAILTPLSPEERAGFDAWRNLKESVGGDPYAAIQTHWRESAAAGGGGLFDDEPTVPAFASVNLSDHADVVRCATENARTLGYEPLRGADGREVYPDLQPGTAWQETDGGGRSVTYGPRTIETIAQDARGRIRAELRGYFFEGMAGNAECAKTRFNPESVRTASDRWTEYCRDMGGEKRAIETVQEFMRGDVSEKFAAAYGQATGKKFQMAKRTLRHADAHAEAMLPPERRGNADADDRRRQAQVQKNVSGRFGSGAVADRVEALKQSEQSGPRLFGADETGARPTVTARPSLGTAIEGALAQMAPHLDLSRPVEGAGDVNFSDANGVKQQRAMRLISENKRQGINLQAGLGKTSVAIGSITDERDKGNVTKALITCPSHIVSQFGGEFYKFTDPAAGLKWHADPGASAEERRAAYADPGTHVCITTPEALRGDITSAVADDRGVSAEEATEALAGMSDDERDNAIHTACQSRGWNFDYSLYDEGHRLLGRAGKKDAHMARVADSVARMTPYFVYNTADVLKNDVSENFDVLRKLDPERYPPSARAAFLRRYGRNTRAAAVAMQREMESYLYVEQGDIGVGKSEMEHVLPMTPAQSQDYKAVLGAYQSARKAKLLGDRPALITALTALAPDKFTGDASTDDETADRLGKSLAIQRDAALKRIVHAHPDGAKIAWVEKQLQSDPDARHVIFAHNLDTVRITAERLAAAGHRVAMLTGETTPADKAKAIQAFAPTGGREATADVIVLSDAGATGANLQRGSVVIHMDTPDTAMTKEQRTARAWRRGQTQAVSVHNLSCDAPVERRARERLRDKADLRDIMTSPAESIDDSGLLLEIEKERNRSAGSGMMPASQRQPGSPMLLAKPKPSARTPLPAMPPHALPRPNPSRLSVPAA